MSYLFCYLIISVIFFVGALSDTNLSSYTIKRSKKLIKCILPVYCLIYFADIFGVLFGLRITKGFEWNEIELSQ